MTKSLPPTSRSLPIALIRAREGVMSPIRDMLADSGLTEQQWRVLRVLDEYGPLDAKTLADQASLLFPSLTRITSTLRSKSLITQRTDDKDRRRHIVEITDRGSKIIEDNAANAAQIVVNFKNTLGQQNYEHLLDLLDILNPNTD